MAGGEGSRLRPMTLQRPKPLVPVCNRAMSEHIVARLKEHGFDDIFVTLYYMGDEIMSYFGDGAGLGVNMSYSVEESPLGTAGAVKLLEPHLDETFLIISGDCLTDIDLTAAMAFHKKSGSMATIVLTRVATPLEYGVVIVDDQGRIKRFLEKPGWGEVFSDTVNTGIYIIEPQVLKLMEPGKKYDWSNDIFPRLLSEGKPIFGSVQPGYWCDIGNLKQYREAHEDFFDKKIKMSIPGRQIECGAWVGDKTEIDHDAKIHPKAIIGANCRIKSGAVINEYTVVGDNCIIDERASVTRSIIFNNTYVGKTARLVGAVILRNNVINEGVRVQDGAIIGDSCIIGKDSRVRTQIKIWPEKNIPSGADVNMNVVYAQNWPTTLFSALGVRRVGNVEFTPEFGARLGSAYGAFLPQGSTVIVSRSPHKMSRVIKRSLVGGLMSMGVDVVDIRSAPLPIARHMVRTTSAAGGVHTRISPYMPEMLLSEFFDENGINIPTGKERKIEAIFTREDYRRTDMAEVGVLRYDGRFLDHYLDHFYSCVNADAIRERKYRIVVDYSHGSLSTMMPPVLSGFNIDAVSVNAYMDPSITPRASALDRGGLGELSKICRSLKADLGIMVDGEAEKISLIDKKGRVISGPRLLALMLRLIARKETGPLIACQVNAPAVVRKIIQEIDGKVLLTQANSRSLMTKTHKTPGIAFAGDIKGGFIFPGHQPAFDAMMSIIKILEYKAVYDISITQLNDEIPAVHMHSETMPITWEGKGKLMRVLTDKYKNKELDLTDGVRMAVNKSAWVMIRPDPTEPLVHVIAEGRDAAEARRLVGQYKEIVAKVE